MVNRDTFDALESTLFDRTVFSHLAAGCLTFSLTLGAEKGIEYAVNPTPAGFNILFLCGVVGVAGAVFGGLTIYKYRRYRDQRQRLFSEERLLADDVIVYTSDGSSKTTSIIT